MSAVSHICGGPGFCGECSEELIRSQLPPDVREWLDASCAILIKHLRERGTPVDDYNIRLKLVRRR